MTAIRNEVELQRYVAYLRQQALPLEVSSGPLKSGRTSQQNRYLFGVCYPPIAEAMGYDVDDVHEYMLGRHFGWVDKPVPKTPRNPDGIESKPFRTTTTDENGKRKLLPKADFAKFVDTVHRIASHAGVFIAEAWIEEEANRRAA
ncbi:hypothetical protein [Pseudoxanthomonas sp.]|uniref:hypothetical protein n=1 Tax=Pseudoxanthomonas sp. TaxID=1871049 RepID=UPI00261A1EEA|nr:hypothetical protein [Pseudoxanthomonas sp.]WDS36222.1 MAG: hypothetical protein O8I58_18455 [Pseudoxanthomonas sp.]